MMPQRNVKLEAPSTRRRSRFAPASLRSDGAADAARRGVVQRNQVRNELMVEDIVRKRAVDGT